jgi:hypothetical protein
MVVNSIGRREIGQCLRVEWREKCLDPRDRMWQVRNDGLNICVVNLHSIHPRVCICQQF